MTYEVHCRPPSVIFPFSFPIESSRVLKGSSSGSRKVGLSCAFYPGAERELGVGGLLEVVRSLGERPAPPAIERGSGGSTCSGTARPRSRDGEW